MNHRDRSDNFSTTSFQNLHMFKNTSHRVSCNLGDPSESSIEPAASATASSSPSTNMGVDVDALRPPLTPLIIDNTGLDHITCLERTVCSNYFCCGGQHPDLHALLEHFEEDHVIVLAPNGQRLYPSEGFNVSMAVGASPTTTPTSSRSSSVTPLLPSLSSSSSTSTSSGPSSPSSSTSTLTSISASIPRGKPSLAVHVPPVYTPFTPSLPVDPADPYALDPTTEIIMSHDATMYDFPPELLPPFPLFPAQIQGSSSGSDRSPLSPPDFDPSSSSSSSGSGEEGDEDMSDTSSSDGASPIDHPSINGGTGGSSLPTYIYGTDTIKPIAAIPKHVSFAAAPSTSGSGSSSASPKKSGRSSSSSSSSAAATTASVRSKARNRGAVSGSSRKREKMYRCPEPRCTKAYLNPNGLKYHIEKGTCKLEDDVDVDVSEESNQSDSPPSRATDEDMDIQMHDSPSGGGAGDPLGHDHHAPYSTSATATTFPPSDSDAPTPLPQSFPPHAHYPSQAEVTSSASGVTISTPIVSVHHQQATGSVGDPSLSPNARQDVQISAQASIQPQQQLPPPPWSRHRQPAVYHYPVPSYPMLGSTATSYFHKSYYTSTATTNAGAEAAASPPASSHSSPAASQSLSSQHPQPIIISSSRMQ